MHRMSKESFPLGVNVMPLETRRSAILHLATRADELGYQAFTLPETWSYDTTLVLTEIAGRFGSIFPHKRTFPYSWQPPQRSQSALRASYAMDGFHFCFPEIDWLTALPF